SEDLGSALSYKALTPPTSLGWTGFDIGVEATYTQMAKSEATLKTLTGGTSVPGMIIPKLHAYKGLPFDIDVGAFISQEPTTGIQVTGAEIRYGILPGSMALPAIGLRAAMTQLSGVDKLSFSTTSVDLSISKGFLMFTPYAGVGLVMVNSSTSAVTGINSESFNQNKYFAGGNFNMGLMNIAVEWDQTGDAQSYGAKFGFRW
ncbi:MAG: hypothetical protein RLZZ144_516, partial [Pseudomonadota bacterium]